MGDCHEIPNGPMVIQNGFEIGCTARLQICRAPAPEAGGNPDSKDFFSHVMDLNIFESHVPFIFKSFWSHVLF